MLWLFCTSELRKVIIKLNADYARCFLEIFFHLDISNTEVRYSPDYKLFSRLYFIIAACIFSSLYYDFTMQAVKITVGKP